MNLDRTDSARELFDRAAAAMEAMQLGEANAMIRLAIRQNPDDPAARLLDAQIQLKRNLPEFALVALDVRDQLDPDGAHDPRYGLLRAEALVAAAFDDMAEKLLRELAVLLPEDPRPHRMLAAMHVKSGRKAPAAEHLREVRRLAPKDQSVHRLLNNLLHEVDPGAAVDAALALDAPRGDSAQKLRTARTCRNSQRLRDAADLYAQLLREQPDDAALWHEAGELADELGESDLAVTRLARAADLALRQRCPALEALAKVHMHCGRFTAAAVTWWRAARIQRSQPRPWAGLWLCAHMLERHKLMKRARAKLEALATPSQRCAILAELWPHAAASAACRAPGSAAAEPVTSSDAETSSPLQQLTSHAAATLGRTACSYPDRADVHFHLAVCRHLLGDRARAEQALTRALTINPRYAAAQHLLASLRHSA
ncbi:MAG: tetratricopeptide repeat protein [Phycisphaeraceae bacterium]|nr:tetratricopeptide repeat protein [Phycisphaeraceae bacterium]